MATLILGITLDDLGAAVILLPLCGALLNLLLVTFKGRTEGTWMQPLVKTLGIGAPLLGLILLALMYSMLSENTSALVLGPYAIWFSLERVIFDVALWLDPLVLLWSAFVLGLGVFVALYRFIIDDTTEDLALAMAKQQLFLFFILLLLWADSLPLLYLAWEGLALCGYWMWQATDHPREGRVAMFWLTRFANLLFLLGLFWAVDQLTVAGEADAPVRLTFALVEEHRRFFSPGLLYAWLIPALVYVAQWPLSFWYLRTREAPHSVLCWFYGFGLSGAGLYLLTRFNVLILSREAAWYCLELVGALTALFSAVAALRAKTLRGILVAAVLSHFGLIVCAFGGGNFAVAIMHWFFIAVAASLLALGAGIIYRSEGTDEVSALRGLAKKMPWLALSTLLGCLALIGLPPLATFISQYQLLWNFASEARHGALAATGLSSLLLTIAVSRWWAAPFLGECITPASEKAPESAGQASWLVPALLALVLLGASWAALPQTYYGPEALQKWLLPVFEDHLPIRSERFSLASQQNFAFLCWLVWFVLTFVVAYLYARRRECLSRQREYWLWWDALDQIVRRVLVYSQRQIKTGTTIVLRHIAHDGLEQKVLDGLLLSGVGSAFNVAGRAFSRLQSGRAGHYLIFMLLGVIFLAALLMT